MQRFIFSLATLLKHAMILSLQLHAIHWTVSNLRGGRHILQVVSGLWKDCTTYWIDWAARFTVRLWSGWNWKGKKNYCRWHHCTVIFFTFFCFIPFALLHVINVSFNVRRQHTLINEVMYLLFNSFNCRHFFL